MSLNTILATAPLTTTNYVLKATGTTIGNSLIFDNGTNVGIGNTNTSYTLDVSGSTRTSAVQPSLLINYTDATSYANLIFTESGTNKGIIQYIGSTFSTVARRNNLEIINAANSDISFFTNNVVKMTITSAGNVGIGVTPNTWNSTYKALQIGASMSLLQDGSSTSSYWGGNLYVGTDGNYRYTINGNGGLFGIESGSIVYYGVASGTAGNVASLIERFNVGTSSSFKIYTPSGTSETLRLICADTIGDGYMSFYRTTGVRKAYLGYGGSNDDIFSIMQEENAAITFGTNTTERMRISSTGVSTFTTTENQGGVYVTSATDNTTIRLASSLSGGQEWRLQTTGGSSGLGVGKLIFKVGGTETASHIPLTLTTDNSTNGGRVGIGVLSPSYQLHLSADSAAKPSTNTWTISSDIRVKENINPYIKGLETILKINPVTYDYNGKAGFDKIKDNIGIIAQDVLDILPESISTYKVKLNDNDNEESELYNFNSHALTYVLINAIKEQQALITSLQEQINELKNK